MKLSAATVLISALIAVTVRCDVTKDAEKVSQLPSTTLPIPPWWNPQYPSYPNMTRPPEPETKPTAPAWWNPQYPSYPNMTRPPEPTRPTLTPETKPTAPAWWNPQYPSYPNMTRPPEPTRSTLTPAPPMPPSSFSARMKINGNFTELLKNESMRELTNRTLRRDLGTKFNVTEDKVNVTKMYLGSLIVEYSIDSSSSSADAAGNVTGSQLPQLSKLYTQVTGQPVILVVFENVPTAPEATAAGLSASTSSIIIAIVVCVTVVVVAAIGGVVYLRRQQAHVEENSVGSSKVSKINAVV